MWPASLVFWMSKWLIILWVIFTVTRYGGFVFIGFYVARWWYRKKQQVKEVNVDTAVSNFRKRIANLIDPTPKEYGKRYTHTRDT